MAVPPKARMANQPSFGSQMFRIHDLRHSFASILVSAGASLPLIGQMLGHTQVQTTQRYAHLFDDPMRDAAETVGQVISGPNPDFRHIDAGRP